MNSVLRRVALRPRTSLATMRRYASNTGATTELDDPKVFMAAVGLGGLALLTNFVPEKKPPPKVVAHHNADKFIPKSGKDAYYGKDKPAVALPPLSEPEPEPAASATSVAAPGGTRSGSSSLRRTTTRSSRRRRPPAMRAL